MNVIRNGAFYGRCGTFLSLGKELGALAGATRLSTKADFDGVVSEVYSKLAEQHRHPRGPWQLILDKVKSLNLPAGSKILDVASGPGEPAVTIAKYIPSAQVFSTDISSDMVAIAESKIDAVGTNLKAMVADTEDLYLFPDESIDCVTCCYGFMFPQDKIKAVSECHRVLKPGGLLIATYWARLDMMLSPEVLEAVCEAVGVEEDEAPAFSMNPLALSDPGLFDEIARAAGFTSTIESCESQYPFDFGRDPTEQYVMGTFLVRDQLDELNAHDIARSIFEERFNEVADVDPETQNMVVSGNVFVMASVAK